MISRYQLGEEPYDLDHQHDDAEQSAERAAASHHLVRCPHHQGNAQDAIVLFSSKTLLQVIVPPNTVSGPITVIVNGLRGTSQQLLIIAPF